MYKHLPRMLWVIGASVSFNVLSASTLYAQMSAYAPPMTFGPWVKIYEHCGGGRGSLKISYSAKGDTAVYGQVKYFKPPSGPSYPNYHIVDNYQGQGDRQVTASLPSGTSIMHGASCASVQMRFYGAPLGSFVDVDVEPGR
jgi:hypothetical protein